MHSFTGVSGNFQDDTKNHWNGQLGTKLQLVLLGDFDIFMKNAG